MAAIKFLFDDSLVPMQEIEYVGKELAPEIERIAKAREQGYETVYASINAPFDQPSLLRVQAMVQEKMALQPSIIVLIGIGGSNLGTVAIFEALRCIRPAVHQPLLICVDTIDSNVIARQLQQVEQELKNGRHIIINAVTKSGTTTETIINFELFLDLLKKYHPQDYQKYVVVTSDADSNFSAFAQESGFATLPIPSAVGGRYSVFTSVGLFPLGMLGIEIEQLLSGAREMMSTCFAQQILQNPAAMSAIIKYIYYKQCVNINDFFTFAVDLQPIGLWYRQLMGESIGKELNKQNKKVEVGITPTVSVGSIDLHSVGQLYLGGPRDKFTTFVCVQQNAHDLYVPQMPIFEQFVPKIQDKKVSSIMDAILQGVQAAYRNNKRPFCTIELSSIEPGILGQLLQFYMMEIMYLGFLFEVNPFDQPNVELYKKETRRILSES